MLRPSIAASALAVLLSVPVPALAAEPASPSPTLLPASSPEPNVRAALAVGALTMIVPGVLGGFRTALGASDGEKTAGLLVASGGFALAPIFSHFITREYWRGLAFGAVPIATTIAATAFISEVPGAVYSGDMGTRTAFGVLLGVGLIDAVLGLADSAAAGDRLRERRALASKPHAALQPQNLFLLPGFTPHGATLTFGGAL